MRLKRVFYTLLILIILVGIGMIPWIDGYFFKKNYLTMIEVLNAETEAGIQVKEYHLGWLGSYAKLEINMHSNEGMSYRKPAPDFKMTIEQNITHGPFVQENRSWKVARGYIQSDISLPRIFKTAISNQSGRDDLHANTLVSLTGDYISEFETPSFSIKPTTEFGAMTWSGFRGSNHLKLKDNQIHQVVSELIIGSLASQGGLTSIASQDITIQSNMTRSALGLWDGTYTLSYPGFLMSNSQGPMVIMSGFNFSTAVGINENKLYDSDISLSIKLLTIPDYTINPSSIKISEKNIDPKGLLELLEASSKLINAKETTYNPSQMLYLSIPRIITQSTTFNHEINLNTSQGKLISLGEIYWPRNSALNTIDELISNIHAKLQLQISVSLVNALINQIYHDQTTHPLAENVSQQTEAGLLEKISTLTREKQIALDVSIQLKDLIAQHFDPTIFANNIDNFITRKELTPEVATEIKSLYAALHPLKIYIMKPAPKMPAPQKPIMPAEIARQWIAKLIQQGYIKQVGDDYIVDMFYEKGTMKLNGIDVSGEHILSLPTRST